MVTTKGKAAQTTDDVQAETAKKKVDPIWSDHIDQVWVNIYAFENKTSEGEKFTNYSVTFSRSYKTRIANGQWRSTRFFSLDDLNSVLQLCARAQDHIRYLKQVAQQAADEQEAPEQEAQP